MSRSTSTSKSTTFHQFVDRLDCDLYSRLLEPGGLSRKSTADVVRQIHARADQACRTGAYKRESVEYVIAHDLKRAAKHVSDVLRDAKRAAFRRAEDGSDARSQIKFMKELPDEFAQLRAAFIWLDDVVARAYNRVGIYPE